MNTILHILYYIVLARDDLLLSSAQRTSSLRFSCASVKLRKGPLMGSVVLKKAGLLPPFNGMANG